MIDTSELDDWSADLKAAGEAAAKQGKSVVARGALNIKNDAKAAAPSGPMTPHYPASISYDVSTGSGWIEAEIGPKSGRRQWGLGNLLEYGGHGAAPQPHLEPALDTEEPKFIAAAETLSAKLIEGLR